METCVGWKIRRTEGSCLSERFHRNTEKGGLEICDQSLNGGVAPQASPWALSSCSALCVGWLWSSDKPFTCPLHSLQDPPDIPGGCRAPRMLVTRVIASRPHCFQPESPQSGALSSQSSSSDCQISFPSNQREPGGQPSPPGHRLAY